MMSPQRGAVRTKGREYKINRIFVASGFDEKGPIAGFHITLKDGSKRIVQGGSDLTIQLETAEAYELAMRLLDNVRTAHVKHGGGFLEARP